MLADHFTSRLDGQLASLHALIDAAPLERLTRRTTPGQWSPLQNLAHIGRYHEVFIERVARILGEDAPDLGRYRAESDPGFTEWCGLGVGEIMTRLKASRLQLRQTLTGLEPAEWLRTGAHPAFGAMTITEWVDFFLVHEAHHLYVIRLRLHTV